MELRSARRAATMRFFPKGALALGREAGSLKSRVARALARGARRIAVDVSGVAFVDAAGLGELVACRKLALRVGATFHLEGVSGKTRDLLRLTRLDVILLRDAASRAPSARRRGPARNLRTQRSYAHQGGRAPDGTRAHRPAGSSSPQTWMVRTRPPASPDGLSGTGPRLSRPRHRCA